MGLKDPVGEVLTWGEKPFHVIGVINDIVQSPYGSPRPSGFHLGDDSNFVGIKINPDIPVREALGKIESTFKKYNPTTPFDYQFVDQEFNKKFGHEERIGKLTAFFSVLAIFISCLGIFGLASFVAEQRIKEIGIRKVLGASVLSLWQMLSKDFAILTVISCLIAVPVAYYFMSNWLLQYEYRTVLSWHIFAAACLGGITITLLTVSFQAIKAAMTNPVRSLRLE
jgi:ABC-type antimicrobial peptide transport system permease subunit